MSVEHHVTVRFNAGITSVERGPLLLAWEKLARQILGKPVEVFMDRMADDSKLRRSMTTDERAKL